MQNTGKSAGLLIPTYFSSVLIYFKCLDLTNMFKLAGIWFILQLTAFGRSSSSSIQLQEMTSAV
jgi:hypothetical protein